MRQGKIVALGLCAVMAAVSFASLALAADDDGNVVYQKKQVVDFGDDTIEGDLTKPDGDVFDARKRAHHSKLIRIRPNFRSEVLQSIRSL